MLKRGSQKPTFSFYQPFRDTDGKDCAYLSAEYGLKPDKWQEFILNVWLATDEEGKYIHTNNCLSVPRQNGKNGLLEMIELYKAAIQGRKVLHTAHEVKTARKAFLRVCSFFEDDLHYPELVELVVAIRKTNGQEAVVLTNGGSIEFAARSKSSGRGFSVDDLVFDEAQELNDEQLEAMLSTISASKTLNPQVFMTGTPPNEKCFGTVFKRTRRNVKNNSAEDGTTWVEWGVDEAGDVCDRRRWYKTNPALGIRITEKVIEGELAMMSPEGFARERLGWWDDTKLENFIDGELWDSLKTDTPPADGKMAYGVKFSPDGSVVCLAACRRPKEGDPYIEVLEHRSLREGTGWLCEYLSQRWNKAAAIVIDGQAGAFALIDNLIESGVRQTAIFQPKTTTMAQAASMIIDLINSKAITHYDQELLNDAVLNARKRPIGNNGAFGFMSESHDVTPFEACALAYFGAKTSKRNPDRKLRLL